MQRIKSVPDYESLPVTYPYDHEEAKNFLISMNEIWDSEALIFGIRLYPQDKKCFTPAFSRVWPGVPQYTYQVKVEEEEEEEGSGGERRLQNSKEEADRLLDLYDSNGDGSLNASEVIILLSEVELVEETADGNDTATGEEPEETLQEEKFETITVSALPAQTIQAIDGVNICLERDEFFSRKAYTYTDFQKADATTGACPELFIPCSELTSAANTVCVAPAEKPFLCPITDVRVVAKDRLDEFEPGQATYEQVSPPEGTEPNWILLYSKDFDSPPVRGF